jgi:sRNA-binding regulator protein Hfq
MDLGKTVEDVYLEDLIQHKRLVSVYLSNGIKLKGYLLSHTPEALFICSSAGITQKIHKCRATTVRAEITFNP